MTYNHFWVLQTTPSAPHTTLLDVKMQAEKKSSPLIKLTEVPSLCATSSLGKFSQFEPQNVDSLAKEKKKPKDNNCKRKAKHCSKCHRLLTVCNKDKCKGKQTATRQSLVFQAQASSKIKPPTATPAATPTATPTAIPTPSTTPDTGTTWLTASCSKVLRDVATDGDITECVRCNSPASCNTKIERLPEVIVLEIVKKKKGLKETNTRNIVTGWYTHDGLNNSGNALLTSYSQKMSPKQKQHSRPWHQSLLENSGLTPPRKK